MTNYFLFFWKIFRGHFQIFCCINVHNQPYPVEHTPSLQLGKYPRYQSRIIHHKTAYIMQKTDVQLRVKTVVMPNGTTQTNLVGYVNGMRAYVPNVLKMKADESEGETIANFIKDVNDGNRDVTGYTEGGADVSWLNPRTNQQETFQSSGSCVWGLAVREATASQKLEMQAKLDKLIARKNGTDQVAPRPDAVTELVRDRTNVFTAMRERLATEALAAQNANAVNEPAIN